MKKTVSELVSRIEGYDDAKGFEVIGITLNPDNTYTVQVKMIEIKEEK